MFCKKCGKELKDDALFCPKCGQRTEKKELKNDASVESSGQGNIVSIEPAGQSMMESSEASAINSSANISSQPNSGKGKKWGIIGGAAAGVIAIAAVVIVLVVNKGLPFGSLPANSASENGTELLAEDEENPDSLEGNEEISGETGENEKSGDDAQGNAEPTIAISCREVIYNEGLPNVSLVLKSGHDNPDGDVICEAITQENGIAEMPFSSGDYTLCWELEGYYSGYENISIGDGGIYLVKHLVPYQTEQKAYILVEWNSDKDLDLCVYNAQKNQYINIFYPTDDDGNFLYGDNTGAQGYELIYLRDYTDGIYTIYVRDDASLLAGTTSSMEEDDLKVSIYTSNGLIYQETAAENQVAALWSPVYLYQGQTYELEDYIYDLNEYEWATWDKSDAEFVENLQNQAQNQTQTTSQPQTGTTDGNTNTGNQSQSSQQSQSQPVQQSNIEYVNRIDFSDPGPVYNISFPLPKIYEDSTLCNVTISDGFALYPEESSIACYSVASEYVWFYVQNCIDPYVRDYLLYGYEKEGCVISSNITDLGISYLNSPVYLIKYTETEYWDNGGSVTSYCDYVVFEYNDCYGETQFAGISFSDRYYYFSNQDYIDLFQSIFR